MTQSVDHESIGRQLKREYSLSYTDQVARIMSGIQTLCAHLEKKDLDVKALLTDAGNQISQLFGIREVSIGLKDPADGMFRYEVMVGVRDDAEQALRRLVYTSDDFGESSSYKGWMISKYSKLFLAEDKPYSNGEKESYSRQFLLGSKRRSANECLEEDYLDVLICGMEDELLGWIEISGTRTGNLPDSNTIKWIELISRIIGIALSYARLRDRKGLLFAK
jgi:hypothetical protein